LLGGLEEYVAELMNQTTKLYTFVCSQSLELPKIH
jgi:hypothetical protein